MELILIKDKINRLSSEVKSLKQKSNALEKEKNRVDCRIRLIENNVKRLLIDRDSIVNYCKIKKCVKNVIN
jgi:FtsZ-binding cell division protein ZapB